MSALSNKILSYSPEQYIRFNTAYSNSPTNLGSGGQATWTLSNEAPVLNTSGGIDGEGSWQFNYGGNNDTSITRFRIATSSANVFTDTELSDGDFSSGVWFKVNTIPTTAVSLTSSSINILNIVSQGTTVIKFSITADNSTNKGKPIVTYPVGTATRITNRYDDGNWHYVAVRFSAQTPGTIDFLELYIDGVLVESRTGTFTSATLKGATFGELTQTATSDILDPFELSHFYITPSSSIDATAIAEIWATGSGAGGQDGGYTAELMEVSNSVFVEPSLNIDDIFSTTPATASALMTEPTIAISAGDHTEITTSILVSAEFLPNFAVYASQNINITITEILDASAELINNVTIMTGSDESFSAIEFTASALMSEAFVARKPMTASALMGDHQGITQPSYFKLVKNLNPYLYIHDGLSNPTNYGYQSGTFVRGSDLLTNQTSPFPLDMVAEAKSWRGKNSYNSNGFMTFETTNFANSFNNLLGTGNFAYEIWVNPQSFPDDTGPQDDDITFSILNSEKIELTLEDFINRDFPTPDVLRYISLKIQNSVSTKIELTTPLDASPLNLFNWNHIVINVYQSGIDANQRLVQLWINGQIVINQNISFTTWTDNTDKINYIFGSNAVGLEKLSDMFYDELAIYSAPLTNSQIIQHHNFISTLSPNYIYNASAIAVNATSGDHQFAVTSNVDAITTPITGLADFVMPSVLAQKVINYSAPVLTASALNTDVTVYYGWTIYADPAIASAEKAASYFLNSFYTDYVQANIAPYRYVSFDDANPYTDFGTDNDYSVVPTVVGGTIVNPDLGLNGKSAKTAGLNYVTDGVILKESEWNDSWGTGQNSYHSAFWFQRALDDTSTTGLRVLWNLNGYKDNQHVVLYQYQNKLHMQFNNGSGTWIEQDTGTLDLFDYQRHFIVIDFDHTNVNNNTVRLYVDAVLKSTINLGSYTGSTTNATTADSGPNDEANNHPRLSVGCLITPFAATALPVVPTNTKLIIDEIYWDKNSIDATMVVNLYNAMPDKNNKNIIAEPMNASDEFVMPAISTEAILSAAPATASSEFIDPSLYIERFVVNTAELMEASALMPEPATFVPINIAADVMAASAIFDSVGVVITIPGSTMYASAILKSEGIYLTKDGSLVRYYPNRQMTPWLAYLRATSTEKILPMREVV